MIGEALIGGVLGGVARLAPEVLKFLDRKSERKHELALGQQQFELVKLQGSNALHQAQIAADAGQIQEGLKAIQAAYESQKTGFKWADTVSAFVRPFITYMIFGMWGAVKLAAYVQMTRRGLSWDTAVTTLWTADDVLMLAGVTNFWFLSRVFERKT